MTDDLPKIIERVKAGTFGEEDVRAIAAAIQSRQVVLVLGDGAVGVAGDVTAPVVTGTQNVVGDRNIVIHLYGADAQTIQAVLAMQQKQGKASEQAGYPEQNSEPMILSAGQRHRLKERWDRLQADWALRSQKVKRLRSDLAIEAGTAVKFQLEQQLQTEEEQLVRLEDELTQIETTLQESQSSNPTTLSSPSKTMTIPEPFTAIPVTAGILTNIATDILKYHAQSLEGTLAGQALKWAGLIEPNLYDRLHEILWKALDLYFNTYPERDLLGVDSFFLDADVSRAIGSCILERQPIDRVKIQQAFERHIGIHAHSQHRLQTQGLSSDRIIDDFIDCYRRVLREQLTLPQVVVLLELLNQNETLVAEIRASEQRMLQYIAELQANQLSAQSLTNAYQQGQQQIAIALTEEMNVTGLGSVDQTLQTIQARLQPIPALFEKGLCKGQLLSAKPNQYFVSHGFTPDLLADWRQTLEESLAEASDDLDTLQPYFAGDTLLSGFRLCGICEQLYTSRFSMFLLPPSQNRNVYLELGIAIGLGAPFFLIQHYEAKIPSVLAGLSLYAKGGLFRTMRRELAGQMEEYDFGVVHFIADLPQAGSKPKYLVVAGELIEDEDFEGSIMDALRGSYPHLEAESLTNQLNRAETAGWVLDQLVKSIQSSRFAVYRVDEACSPTTFLALGISIGLNRPFLMVHRTHTEVPLDLRGMGMYQFPNFVALQKAVVVKHQEFFNRYAK